MTELAGCVIKDKKDQLLLIHRTTKKSDYWEIPGSRIKEGEKPEETAARGVGEELGVEVKVGKEVCQCKFSDKAGDWHYTWFETKIVKGRPQIQDKTELSEYKYFGTRQMAALNLSVSVQAYLAAQLQN